jgi:hypothetical protein
VLVLVSVLGAAVEFAVGEMWLNIGLVQPLTKIAVAPMAATLRGDFVLKAFTANLFFSLK